MNSRKLLLKITEKWPVKVLSVAAALILSVFHKMNTLETRFFSAPLRIEASETLIPANSYVQVLRVSIRGESGNIYPILEEDIETFIDLKKYTSEGTYKIPVQIRRKGSALGNAVVEISVEPAEIPVNLESRVNRNIPVLPVFRGNVAQGFELTSQSIIPDNVFADGPKSAIQAIHEFYTETIDIEGRYGDFSIIVNIINDDPFVAIHGSRMIEYRGTIRRIQRNLYRLTNENTENAESAENGENAQ